jgi:biopolymer transport protein ExbD
MTFKTHCQVSKGLVDAAPLVNLVFLLLLFFVLNSQFVMQPGVSVSLTSLNDVPMKASFQSLVVTVARDDLLFFDDRLVPMDKLEQTLHDAVQQGRGHELIIKADKQVAQGTVMEIMGAAVRAGIPMVNIAARPDVSAAGTGN